LVVLLFNAVIYVKERRVQRDSAKLKFIGVHFLNIFQASLCPSSGVQE
jgi:hypothetical protein